MAAMITRYVLVDADDHYVSDEIADLQCAINLAGQRPGSLAVVALNYEFADSELVWTPDGRLTWPG
jgi:hypothetical protein